MLSYDLIHVNGKMTVEQQLLEYRNLTFNPGRASWKRVYTPSPSSELMAKSRLRSSPSVGDPLWPCPELASVTLKPDKIMTACFKATLFIVITPGVNSDMWPA